jgi:hypothetical protein
MRARTGTAHREDVRAGRALTHDTEVDEALLGFLGS